MNNFLLFLLAFGLGFVAAIPVGGSQIEMAKRAIAGHLRAAEMVVLGSVSSDIIYGIIALYGIAPFLEKPEILALFSLTGALILWILTYLTFKESKKPHTGIGSERRTIKSKRWSYLTGFSLAVSNPPMILTWLVGTTLAKQLGLVTPFSPAAKAVFIAGGALGLGAYLGGLGVVIYRLKHFIPLTALGKVYRWLAVTLFLLSFYFVYGAVKYLATGV
jgi:threonine/homoserine/homoserine lactone efflux protein